MNYNISLSTTVVTKDYIILDTPDVTTSINIAMK